MNQVNIEDIYGLKDIVYIDVRTPLEFTDGAIKDAINLPLFSNEERAKIGTTYKNVSRQLAKEMGLEIASGKLIEYYRQLKTYHEQGKKIVIYCARGGMRSGSLVTVMELMSLNVHQLVGGYKSYRRFLLDCFEDWRDNIPFLVLRGGTGSGKTELLKRLALEGLNVIDLEGLANHRGSSFGHIGLGAQTPQKAFENLLFHEIFMMPEGPVFIEAESGKIGVRVVPAFAIEGIKKGTAIKVVCDLNRRAERLLEEYKDCEDSMFVEQMLTALQRIKAHVRKDIFSEIETCLRDRAYGRAAELLLIEYYDPQYQKWEKEDHETVLTVDTTDMDQAVEDLKEYYRSLS